MIALNFSTWNSELSIKLDGYRSQVTKMWCQQKKRFQRFDVPDYLHIQGIYETTMYTKAYDSIDQKIAAESKKTNSLIGVGVYKDNETKKSTLETTSETIG